MIGQTVSHYKILEKLGEGGMGVVYRAHDTELDRDVALKFLPHHITANEAEQARFLQEARAAALLNHPNICTIHAIEKSGDKQFIVMEYVEGKTLREIIPVGKLQDAITYALQIAEALQEAHTHGIVHRDIKAENIMVNSKNQVKVMDFGLAKLKGSLKLTKTSSTVGTLAYMAPEQIEGGEVDARSDIFSFGVVLFEVLTGHLPFHGEHEASMMYSIVNEEPEPPQQYRTDLSPVLVNLIQRALEKSPGDRYQLAEEIVIELKRLQKKSTRVSSRVSPQSRATEGAPTIGEEATVVAPGAKRPHPLFQNKFVMPGAAVLAVVFIVASVYQFITRQESARQGMFSIQSMRVTRLTSEGKAHSAAVSPDGRYVVYSTVESGQQSLWVRQVATNSNVQIIPSSEASYYGITFSRDGNYIYYVMSQLSTGLEAVCRIPVLGGPPRKILEHVESGITLSPDNEEFAFTRYYPTTGEFALMIAETDGSGERRLASHKGDRWFSGQPAWSPDGKMIACPFGSYEGGFHHSVVTVALEGAIEQHFTQKRWYYVDQVEWLPDGSGLLVRGQDRGSMKSQVFELSHPEGEATRTTNDLLDYSSLSLTNDAQTLCVVQGDYRSTIWILPQGSAARAQQVTHGKDEGLPGVSWTPDGRIVYGSSVSGTSDLWIMDRDGKNQRQLTTDAAMDYTPAVSPDGKFVLFATERSGMPNIWRIELDGSKPRQLTAAGDNYSPSISPDGLWFVFDSWAKGINLIMKGSTAGGEPVQLSETNGSSPAISPDGKLIAYVYLDEQTRNRRIEVIQAEGGKPVKEFTLPHTAGRSVRWSPDGLAVQFLVYARGATNIWSQPLSGGLPKQITDFDSDYLGAFDWSPDGKFLVVSRYTISRDVILMSNAK